MNGGWVADTIAAGRAPHVLGGREIGPEVVTRVVREILEEAEETVTLAERVQETVYHEGRRLDTAAHGSRDERARAFVRWLRRELPTANEHRRRELLREIVERYVREIGGAFSPRIHRVTTQAIPLLFSIALRRVRIEGQVSALQSLARRGAIVLAPCHVSNLDSVLLGWAIHHLGLPPFAYGAGLNLFSNPVLGFFMRNLGAYTIDRRKTDPLYRTTLKAYATVLLEHEQHSLFFPGGTRSRSGSVERRLKLGLLGTAVVAYRRGLENGGARRPIFVVPCTLSYPLVIEAASLVGEYLRAEGESRYLEGRDEFDHPTRLIDYLRGVIERDLVIHVRFGKPLDVVGNDVGDDGASLDPHGRAIDPRGYFARGGRDGGGEITRDDARDEEYARMLGVRVVDAYRRDTVALPTSALAFAVFERIRRDREELDLFRLLSSVRPAYAVPLAGIVADVARIVDELGRLEAAGELVRSPALREAPDAIVRQAIEAFRTYHSRPALVQSGDQLEVLDAPLVYYYKNRLEGRHLLGAAPIRLGSARRSSR